MPRRMTGLPLLDATGLVAPGRTVAAAGSAEQRGSVGARGPVGTGGVRLAIAVPLEGALVGVDDQHPGDPVALGPISDGAVVVAEAPVGRGDDLDRHLHVLTGE